MRTLAPRKLCRLLVATACLSLTFVVTGGVSAAGASTTLAGSVDTYDVLFSNDRLDFGDVTVTRSVNGDGTDTVAVAYAITGNVESTHLCYSAEPFTGRTPPGQCQLQASSATGVHRFAWDTGDVVYLQFHAATG